MFTYAVPEKGKVGLKVVDMSGDLVCVLIPPRTTVTATGVPRQVAWRGENSAGRFAGAGLYVYIFTYTPDASGKTITLRKPIGLIY